MKLTKKQTEKIKKYDKLNQRLKAIKKKMQKGYFKNMPDFSFLLGFHFEHTQNKSDFLIDLIMDMLDCHNKGCIYLRVNLTTGGYIDLKVDDDSMKFWITLLAMPD